MTAVRPAARPAIHQAASLLLTYPDAGWPARLAAVAETMDGLPGAPPAALLRFCAYARDTAAMDLAARYVLTFDRSRRRTLHLTYYTDGDTRRRGASLARLKARYRAHGWQPDGGELPDFLPAVLEFAARCPRSGLALLGEHRPALDLLGQALEAYRSPYADVLRAVRDSLPPAVPADRAATRTLARTGPPGENVGLDVFPGFPGTPGSPGSADSPDLGAPGSPAPGPSHAEGARR
ncbi:nitrate reductase molybdenum cofactor assembly chaperone [Streptomyces varsoviensis]|uniref:nitrate reductase molybdenum cofactor assembly chaperone n=1 Tax=Streptomyces varsoviensis TaxID=67373 RepID=UPI0033CC5B98